ncbi:hypothetical protein O181_063130 [Austropuccinia psidii MF-1]|uniref:Uncharacterized protein n=1 Tax=Austropuccinia psidii MF-1 TaxID=1389203 RepID=A0A9Q3EQN5_9BASI|nr:hypothetical protein [Austropuccinia psidii MF-1]
MSFPHRSHHIINENSQPDISQILQSQNQHIHELRTKLEQHDQEVEALLAKVSNLEVQPARNQKTSFKVGNSKLRENISKIKGKSSKTQVKARTKNTKGSNPKNTHQRAASAPPTTSKTRPNQLNMKQTPQGFKPTKDAFFAHIRIMWGLIFEKSIPVLPDPALLKEFYNRFDYANEIQEVAKSSSAVKLIPESDVITLRGTQPGRKKVGKAIVNVQEFFILYIQALLAKLGIRRWAPALDEPIDTLYNEACRISAIQTFRQVSVGGAYQYMNINLRFLNNIGLLEATYNHFVHYLKTKIWKRETKESGAYLKDLERGAISKNRQRLQKSHYQFAVAQDFPKRYLKILSNIDSHSDDEFVEDVGFVIKHLPYRSKKATIFMRRVDEEIQRAKRGTRSSQKHIRIESKNPNPTTFGRVPQGLPIDFFDPEWYNDCPPAQKTLCADIMSIAFLPDAMKSIRGIQHPDEKLGDKRFSEKYWDEATQPYDLSHEIAAEDDDNESNLDSEDDSSSSGTDLDEENDSEEEESNENSEIDGEEMMDEDVDMQNSENLQPQRVGQSIGLDHENNWANW